MTLIAAFRCDNAGVVLCSDSQETIDIPERGSYRVSVDKLERQDAGEYEIAMGGAGDGALVDGFVSQLVEVVTKWRGSYQETATRTSLRRFVCDYYQKEVALSPAHPDDKNLGFIICLRHKYEKSVSLWQIMDLHVRNIPDLTLLGWEEPLYWREAKRLYHLSGARVSPPSTSEAILLGVHLFSIAKDTSNVISGDTKILVVRSDGIHVLKPNDVKELEERVRAFEYLSSLIFLALPDVTVSQTELTEYLRNFQKIAIQLHLQLTLHVAMTAAERLRALPAYPTVEEFPEDPYLQLPTWEQLEKDLKEDENIIAIQQMAKAYTKQTDAESGWEQFTSVERHQLSRDLNKAAHALERMAQLNRALYETGKYGQAGTNKAITTRQEVARRIYTANEQLIRLLETTNLVDEV